MLGTLGAVTVGQSPRDDVMAEMRRVLGVGVQILQVGALDEVSGVELSTSGATGDGRVLVSRMRDGTEVKIGEAFIVPRVQRCIESLEDRVQAIVLLCTGSFPSLRSSTPLLFPDRILRHLVIAVGAGRLGVLTPAPEQVGAQRERWRCVVPHVVVHAASPYGPPDHIRRAAGALARAGVDLLVMDCIGYTHAMKKELQAALGCPIVLASSMVARVLGELVES